MLLENWKDIPLDKTVEEINREALNEDATLPERKTWDYGQGYTRPFNKFGYQAYKTRETDTSDYISKLKFNESTKKSQRLQEGPGAGYSIYFYDIKLKNVKIDKIWEDKYGVQQADFTAEIVPGKYDWSADGYDWAIGNRNKEFDGDMTFYDKVEIKEGSTVEGSCENGYQAWGDPNSTWTEEDFIKEIQGEEYILGELFGGGYIHSDIPDEYHMEDDIDCSDERSGYKNSYVSSADLKLDAWVINQAIEDTRYYDDEDLEDEDYDEDFEESQKPIGRLTERIHKIEHGNGIIGYAEPGEWEHLFFERKPCGHITEDGKVYLCKDCPQEVYDAFSDYKLTKCSFLDSNLDTEDYDLHLATDDRQAGQWYESKMREYQVGKRLSEPVCYVIKRYTTKKYVCIDSDDELGWTDNLSYAEAFDSQEEAEEFAADKLDSLLTPKRVDDEEEQDYLERAWDIVQDILENEIEIEPIYRDSLKESRRHPDPNKWKKGDWAIYKGKRYVTSMFLGGDMVKLENHEGSIVVPQSEVYKATKKDINESNKSVKKKLHESEDCDKSDCIYVITWRNNKGEYKTRKTKAKNEKEALDKLGFVREPGYHNFKNRTLIDIKTAYSECNLHESKKSDKSRLREGTWEVPNTVEKAQAILDLMQKPLSSKEAPKAMYNLYGDDRLFDSFFGNSKDVRSTIKRHIGRLVSEIERYPNSWKRGNTPIAWDPKAVDILRQVANFNVKDPHWIESSVRQRLDEPVCYVIKNSETGEYASLDLNNDIEWTKNLGEAESFDNKDSAWDFREDEVLSTISLYRGEEEEDWEYDERNLDYRDSLRDDTFTIEPVYRDSLNESTLREGKVRSERKDYPYGISKYTDYEDDQVKRSYYSLPYGFRSDRDDQEDWERDLRYKDYIDYEKDASDWLDKNGDAWNDSHNAYLKSVDDYDNKVASLKIEAYDTEEYKNLTNELKKARKYRDYAEGHGWFKTAEQQNKKATEIGEQIKKYVGNYVKSHIDIQNPGEEVDNYYNDFMNVYNTHRSKLDADIEARKAQFASAAEGKELFSGRDQNNDHHFYYKNGNKYRQIGSRGSVSHPFGYNRGIRDYYETPDATQEFGDYKEEDIRFLKPIADWNTKVHTREEDSTD